jgi:hypothetical protein
MSIRFPFSRVWVSIHGDGIDVSCTADLVHSNLIKTSNNGQRATATVNHVLHLLDCLENEAPISLSLQCGFDGIHYRHSEGRITIISNGERSRSNSNNYSATADCMVEVNGQTYTLSGGDIMRNVTR